MDELQIIKYYDPGYQNAMCHFTLVRRHGYKPTSENIEDMY